jgi:transposase-like protein
MAGVTGVGASAFRSSDVIPASKTRLGETFDHPSQLRRRRGKGGRSWYVNETYVKVQVAGAIWARPNIDTGGEFATSRPWLPEERQPVPESHLSRPI